MTIKRCRTVILDVDIDVQLMSVVVWGTLIIENRPSALVNIRTVCVNIQCHTPGYCGKIIAGSPESPFLGQLAFIFSGDILTEVDQCGPAGPINGVRTLGVGNGTLQLHGRRPARMWGRLRSTAEVGERTIRVLGVVDWQKGDEVFLTSTSPYIRSSVLMTFTGVGDGDDSSVIETTKQIPALEGFGWDTEVLLVHALNHRHVSVVEKHDGYTADMRSEVGLFDSHDATDGTTKARFNIKVSHDWPNHWDYRFRRWEPPYENHQFNLIIDMEGTGSLSGVTLHDGRVMGADMIKRILYDDYGFAQFPYAKWKTCEFFYGAGSSLCNFGFNINNCLFKAISGKGSDGEDTGNVGWPHAQLTDTTTGWWTNVPKEWTGAGAVTATSVEATTLIDNVFYRYSGPVKAKAVIGNLMANCAGEGQREGFFFRWDDKMVGNAAAGGIQGYRFMTGKKAPSPGQPGFRVRDFSNNTGHHLERGLYCDEVGGHACGSPGDPLTGVTFWHCLTALYLYSRYHYGEHGSDRQKAMAAVANMVLVDNEQFIFASGVSGHAGRHGILHVGWAFTNMLLLARSDSNPRSGRCALTPFLHEPVCSEEQIALNLVYFMSEERTFNYAPALCGDQGGTYFEGHYGNSKLRGSPIGIGGETRVTGVTFLRFGEMDPILSRVMKFHTKGGAMMSAEGAQPLFFKDITIDQVSRDNLVYYEPPLQAWISMEFCIRADCDGRKKAVIHDVDGSLTGLGPDSSVLSRGEFMNEYISPEEGGFGGTPRCMLHDPN